MKKSFLILTLLMGAIFLFGCGSDAQEKAAKEVLTQYTASLYNIEDYNQAYQDYAANPNGYLKGLESSKKFFTQEGYNQFISMRTAIVPLEACARGKHTLYVKNISFDKVTADGKDKLVIDYTVQLKAVYSGGEKITDQPRQTTLIKENYEWKISNDWLYINDLFQADWKLPI